MIPIDCGQEKSRNCGATVWREMEHGEELQVVEEHLRKQGFRWTAQRRLIVEAAFGTHEHFSAEELLDMCRERDASVSRATVYRTLSVLEEAGFVEGLDTGDGSRKFEHVLGHDHHDHMICTECGKIIEFYDEELEQRQEAVAKEHGFVIRSHQLKLFGSCNEPGKCDYAKSKGSRDEAAGP